MDIKELQEKVETHLSCVWKEPVKVSEIFHLSGGACQDNYALELVSNSTKKSVVLRTDKGGSLLSSLSKRDEYKVAELVFKAGVKTPTPVYLEEESSVIGSPFFLMEKIAGKATGRYITKDKELDLYRKTKMVSDLASNLAKLHTVTPESVNDEDLKLKLKLVTVQNYITLAISDLRKSLDELPEAHPAIELCLNWMELQAPNIDKIVLVHGDYRTGNFMMNPDGLQGILDFEFAHWGDRHEDIAWLCMRDWRFGRLNKEVGGFGDRIDFYKEYEATSGIKVDPFKVTFWEIMGNIRWAIGSAQQAERHLSGKDKGIELASIGRRTAEMEWEAIRLIEEIDNAV
ncbi:phosphotransferase enzyme family protein [Leptospira yanagawae serovar Saopaulo str. Sao Paulo = ATCC 700523]|uniref:Phosphotransferase enzyme family protein n=1 Tax=Leptospira yanagawae serovar Saopaulo str. Sao Paulo = ATCC 700523 TaxID=1249483 RepID=A0A5E8HFA5_9LEPT|nr:phosphotransferase family protein [Leptospira yanagawae]EOQ89368.1 phosphotransferase enzyme family protein [Leptospira yanagawae serovar Saopaulo str. Sao Paulo = ATCC 700523]